jgi:lipopolysaccharide export system protein LptA
VKLPSGQYNNFLGGGVTGRCPAQSLTLVADSAEYFGDLRVWHLGGNVHYNEPRIIMDSQVATYYLNEERLLSEGDVHALLPSGTTLVGPRVEYWRAIANTRPRARMVAPGRPTIQVITKDSTGKPSEPMQVVANTVTMDGDSLVYASGKVEITRSDVFATGDSAAMDSGRQFARLLLRPSITSRGKRPFTLYGTVIDLFGQNRALERVFSQGNAKSVSQDATLTADTLDFRMARGFLQRVFGWGASRSHAVNPQYDVVADSLDVMMPDQRLREVRAVRKAFAQSVPDSTRLHTTERDWLRGDTIVAHFDTTGVGDTTKQPPIRQLVALGHASSFYHIATKDTTALGPAINYVKGRDITIAFVDKQVRRVTVLDQAAGLYLEPGVANDSTKQKARTTTTAPAPNPRPRRP